MPILLLRVDERLIHGQVVVGWGAKLHPERIVVIDDELADSAWEQELYCLGLPPDVRADFFTVDAARTYLSSWREGSERLIVLTRDVSTMLRLSRDGLLRGAEINIGGIHHSPGRREVLPYVFLSHADESGLRDLAAAGASVTAGDLPSTRRVELAQLLEGDSTR